MKLSEFIEQHEQLTADLPGAVVSSIRKRLSALDNGEDGIWATLSKLPNVQVGKEKPSPTVDAHLATFTQAVATALLEKTDKRNKLADGLSWNQRMEWCQQPEDFLKLFAALGLSGDEWKASSYMQKTNSGLAQAIVKKFGDWEAFLKFMGIAKTIPYTERVKTCLKPKDFLVWFKEVGIAGDEWKQGNWLYENYQGVRAAIMRTGRWKTWDDFLKFMSVEKEKSWPEEFAACKTRGAFEKMFERKGIPYEAWQRSHTLLQASSGAHGAVYSDERFGSWGKFAKFMGIEKPQTWAQRIAACKEPEHFDTLFEEKEVPEGKWTMAKWLQKNGYNAMYHAILADGRWKTWADFCAFMGDENESQWTWQVAQCKTRKDFLTLFERLSITREVWTGAKALRNAGYRGLQAALSKRFGDWEVFIRYMDVEADMADEEFNQLSKLKVEEAVALLQHDPLKLKLYMQFAHPELSEDDIDRLVIRSFKGLVTGPNETKEVKYLHWKAKLPDMSVSTKVPKTTEEKTLLLTGKAPGADSVYIAGCWNRRVRVESDGTFTINIPLKIGEENEIRVMALDREKKVRSAQQEFALTQEGDTDDVAALISLLSDLRADLLSGIQRDPGRTKFFVACAEKVLIKKFGRSFEGGKGYVQRLIANTESDLIKKVLAGVLKNFEAINKMKLPNVQEGSLMFFQKYCAYVIRKKMAEGGSGVILANDPGLGKTRTVLAAFSDEEASIFTPNSVVSAWDEEAGEVLEDPELLVMRDIPHETRKGLLRNGEHLRLVTNVQFLQKTKDAERFALLSNENTVVVHDEAHSRANEQSEQSRGARMLKHKFQVNVSATPFKNPKTLRRILAILEPDDSRFQSDAAFEEAFPARDPQALKALSILKDKYTVRFRKQDVMEEVDPTVLLSQQPHKLPKKEHVSPETLGHFEMSEEQAEAIYELFLNWPNWCRKYDKYMPDDEVAEEDHLRSAGALTKRHALRQTINNPSYIGSDAEDAKAWQVQRIVKKCIKEGRKVVLFCGYNAQALKYAEMFKQYNPALYVGLTSEQGDKKGTDEQPMKFAREQAGKKSKRGWIFDPQGYPKEDSKGETMSALDYERLSFQNAPDRQIIIATYQAGAVGTTFTAGKAMIFDDLPADVVEAIQAEDRIHRIDPHRQTHASVQYYSMQSCYPKRFLECMKKVWVVKQDDGTYEEYRSQAAAHAAAEALETEAKTAHDMFFAQGTYDQVQFGNLRTQKQMFHLINDGIADESILKETEEKMEI